MNSRLHFALVLVALFASVVHCASHMYRMCTNNNNLASYYYNFNGQACNSGYSEWNSGSFRLNAASECASDSSKQVRSYVKANGMRRLAIATNPDPAVWTDEGVVGCGYSTSIGNSHGLPIILEYLGPYGYAYVPHTHFTIGTNLVVFGYTLVGEAFAGLPLFYSAERTSCHHPTNTIRVYTYSSTCPSGYTNEGLAFRTLSNPDNINMGARMILNSYYSSAKSDRILAPISSPNIPSGYVLEGFWGSTYTSGGTGRAQLYSFYNNNGGNYDRFYTTNPGPFSGYSLDSTNTLGYVPTVDNTDCGPDYSCPALKGVTRCYSSTDSSYYWYITGSGSCPSGYTSQGEVAKVLHYNQCVPETQYCRSKCIWGRPLHLCYESTNKFYSLSLRPGCDYGSYISTLGCAFPSTTSGPSPRPGTKWKPAMYSTSQIMVNFVTSFETEYTNTFMNSGWVPSSVGPANAFTASTSSYCNLAYNTCSSVTSTNPFYPTTSGV